MISDLRSRFIDAIFWQNLHNVIVGHIILEDISNSIIITVPADGIVPVVGWTSPGTVVTRYISIIDVYFYARS